MGDLLEQVYSKASFRLKIYLYVCKKRGKYVDNFEFMTEYLYGLGASEEVVLEWQELHDIYYDTRR